MHRSSIAWVIVLGLALASVALSFVRLERLPSFPVLVGPDMKVRALKSNHNAGKKSVLLERDDKISAIESRSVDDLRDFHAVVSHLDYSKLDVLNPGTGSETRRKTLTYQIVRPLHRFNVLLQGDAVGPSGLPPGVEPTDMLVELDGRPLQPAIGPEGLRSIISSRPDAFLVFERKDAVFSGKLSLPLPKAPQTILLTFIVTILVLLAIWRFYHPTLPRWSAVAIGMESLAFSWLGLMIFQYQWLLADYILAYVTITAIIMMRPLGIMARTLAVDGQDIRGSLSSIGLGIAGSLVVCLMLSRGLLSNVELALQLAALLAGFFVVFEVVLTGLSEDSGKLLGERSIYLAGIILFVLLACLLSWGMDEQAFREDRWRWFASIIMALVWFGDILLCFRGVPDSQFAELADVTDRHTVLWDYLQELQEVYPELSIQLLFHHEQRVHQVERQSEGLVISPAEQSMVDAIAILVQEGARIPVSALEDEAFNPMQGIAETMGLEMAFVMSPPKQAIDAGWCDIVFLAKQRNLDEPHAMEIGDTDLDFVQSRMSALVWSAAMIEAMNVFAQLPSAAANAVTVTPGPTKQAMASLEETASQLERAREEVDALHDQLNALRQWYQPAEPLPQGAERLVEPELVEALLYLLEDQEPVVLAGDHGVGKKYVARLGHMLDEQRHQMPCILYDASVYDEAEYIEHFSGDDTRPSALLGVCVGGSLIVEHAEFIGDEALGLLLEEAQQASVRVYLCYVAHDADTRSVLLGLEESLYLVLESREIVIPSFKARKSIQRLVLLHLLDDAAYHHHKNIENMSPSAMKALLGYSYPGQVAEARTLVDVAVRRCNTNVLEIGTLPSEIRRAQSSFG